MTTEICTNRLILRPVNVRDAPDIFAIRSLEAVHSQLLSQPWQSVAEAELWIQNAIDHPGSSVYTIVLRDYPEADNFVGIVGQHSWDKIHYALHPKFWGVGYATEALQGFIESLFRQDQKLLYIEAVVLEENVKSRRVLEKCGFVTVAPTSHVGDEEMTEREEKLQELRKFIKSLGLIEASVLQPSKPVPARKPIISFRYDRPSRSASLATHRDSFKA